MFTEITGTMEITEKNLKAEKVEKGMKKLKKIMIVGGGELQLPLIEAARKEGYQVLVVDMDEQAPGMALAHVKGIISTIDADKILDFALRQKIDGIATAATDFPIRSVARVADEMRLRGISSETALKATDKWLMRKCLKEAGVAVPEFFLIKSFNDLCLAAEGLDAGKEYIVKPVDNSGSRGVFFIEDIKDLTKLKEIFDYSKRYTRSGNLILEEYMRGDEMSVETFSIDGACKVLQLTDKVTDKEPYFVEKMHIQPSKYQGEMKALIIEEVKKALQALGVKEGPAHTEVMVTREGPKIVEVGARTAGDHISSDLLYLSTGIDLAKNLVRFSLEEEIDLQEKCKRASVIKYIEAKEGTIREIGGLKEAKAMEGVHCVKLFKDRGDIIARVKNSTDRPGYVIAFADTAKEAVHIAERACKLIKIEVIE